ncbi:hypothetical protein FUAX_30020 [Fulvitalea axinellae]|uniref:F5/8 type C domain-containing protein n=1 Tax=Fulvitalea axinellae TaxID=1182444 RepID=A0AAU9DHK1_9BACT|nr:hypothetical protein FUAX_30020 [Fulvitalea axinellae]
MKIFTHRSSWLMALAMVAGLASCNEDEEKFIPPGEDKFDMAPLHVLNDVSQYWNTSLFGPGNGFADFLEAENQYQTISLPAMERTDPSATNLWNVYMNTELNRPYSEADMARVVGYSKEKSVAIYAMNDGDQLDNLNAFTKKFNFEFEQGPVGAVSLKAGGSVTPANGGFFLKLEGDWEILAEAGGKPVVAIKQMERSVVIASGIDIFSNRKAENVAFFKTMAEGALDKGAAFVSLSPKNTVAFDSKLEEGKFSLSSASYIADLLPDAKERLGEVFTELQTQTGYGEGADALDISLMPSGDPLSEFENGYLVGAYAGGFPADNDQMTFELGKALHQWSGASSGEALDSLGLSTYVSAMVAENMGVANAVDRFVKPIIEKAKAHPDYQAYDPVTMSEEELKAFPQEVAEGKYLEVIDGLRAKYGDDAVMKFHEKKKEILPAGYKVTPHDLTWIWGNTLDDKVAVFEAFKSKGYSVNADQVTMPGSYNDEFVDPDKFTSYGPQHSSYPTKRLYDGRYDFWHTVWGSSAPPFPHEVVIDMKEAKKLAYIKYYPRNSTSLKDHLTEAEFYVSDDEQNWGEPVGVFVWRKAYTKDTKDIYFTKFKTGRYFKMVIREFWRRGKVDPNNTFSCIAELQLFEFKSYK